MNATQEASLNVALTKFVAAKNEGRVMEYVALTHPNAVAHYTGRGDEAFQRRFDLSNSSLFLERDRMLQVVSDNENFQIEYRFHVYEDESNALNSKTYSIFGMSDDSGETWFFLEEHDYYNDSILPSQQRLID